jgi:hypothetical protein
MPKALEQLNIELPAEERERALLETAERYMAGRVDAGHLERVESRHGVNYRAAAMSIARHARRSRVARALDYITGFGWRTPRRA